MKQYQSRILLYALLGGALVTSGSAQERPGRRGGPPAGAPPAQAGVFKTLTGTISQFNYDRDGEIEGFLLSDHTLVHLPPPAAGRIGPAMHAGDNVQITGVAQTSPSGMQTIQSQGIQDRTSGKTFSVPQPGAAAPYSGSGRIQQLNYGPDGSINGFLLNNGTLASVAPFGGTNPSSVQVGATVTYTGFARNTVSDRTVVDVQSLTINGQTLAMRHDVRRGGPSLPAGAPPPPAASPTPAGRTDEPPPPPPPAQPPHA